MKLATPTKVGVESALQRINIRQMAMKLVSEYSFVLSFILLVVIAATVNQNFFSWANIFSRFIVDI